MNCEDVYTVVRDGVPATVADFCQEMGRCGRRIGYATYKTERFIILFASLDH